MAQVLIRNLDEETVARLKRKAEDAGQSLEAFLRARLEAVAGPTRAEIIAEIDAIRARSRPWQPGEPLAEDILRQARDQRTQDQSSWLSTQASSPSGSSTSQEAKPRDATSEPQR